MSPARSSPERTRRMYELYATGATLAEVGNRFGLSAERIRQIFRDANLHIRSVTETRSLRRDRALREKGDRIAMAYSHSRDIREVARRLEVSQGLVKEIVIARFPPSARRRRRKTVPPRYPTVEMIALLRRAGAGVTGQLNPAAYRRYAEGRRTGDGLPWPSPYTYAKRFGSWRKALMQAGLPVNPHPPSGMQRRFSEQDCIDALRTVAHTIGEAPTLPVYERLARGSNGRLPSAQTVKNRLGGWYDALLRAEL